MNDSEQKATDLLITFLSDRAEATAKDAKAALRDHGFGAQMTYRALALLEDRGLVTWTRRPRTGVTGVTPRVYRLIRGAKAGPVVRTCVIG